MKKFSVSDDAINDAGDVFVVSTDSNKISCDNTDHNYSVIVQQEAEVEIGKDLDEESEGEEIILVNDQQVLETGDEVKSGQELVILSDQVLETNHFVEVINDSTIIEDVTPIQTNEVISNVPEPLVPIQAVWFYENLI